MDHHRRRGPELLRLIIPGQPAPSGSRTADPIMKNNPLYDPTQPTKEPRIVVPPDQSLLLLTGNPKKIPVLDDHGRPMVRQRHASKETEPWMELVAYHAKMAWAGRELLDGALWIDMESWETRPKAHYRTGKFSHLLKPDAPAYPYRTMTGDSDKLRRAIEDALTDVVWIDDKRVTWGADVKDFAENVGETEAKAVIRVGRMEAQTVTDLGLVSPDPEGQASLLAAA